MKSSKQRWQRQRRLQPTPSGHASRALRIWPCPAAKKLAAEAKFTKTMSAAEFAEAMVKNAKTQGATYLAQVQKDAQDSGVNGVTNTPPTDKTEGDAFIAAIKGVAPKN